jgi:hypothetical protein
MKSVKFFFTLPEEGVTIPSTAVSKFQLDSSIEESYPRGFLQVDDPQGTILEKMYLKPGTKLLVSAQESAVQGEEEAKVKNFGVYVITGLRTDPAARFEDATIQSPSSLGSEIIVEFAHPWALFSDYASHAYKGKIGDIVDRIISSSKRGFTFAGIFIASETDDDGSITRYKINESEQSFIHNKLLPYATIDKQPVYSFVNEKGEFYLTNFKRMYDLEPLAILLPPVQEVVGTLYDEVQDKQKAIFHYFDTWWQLGEDFEKQMRVIKRWVQLENSADKITFRGLMPYIPPIKNGSILLRKSTIANVEGTDAANIPHRDFLDGLKWMVNDSRKMDSYFTATVVAPFNADLASVGYTVDWRIPSAEDPTTKHWLSGKWLVVSSRQVMNDKSNYFSILTLAKPAITDDAENFPDTLNPQDLYNPGRDNAR